MMKSFIFLTILLIPITLKAQDPFTKMATKMAAKSDVPTLSIKELKKEIKKQGVILLDAREEKEFNVSHIPGAIYVGHKRFDLNKTKTVLSKNKKIVVYCSLGYRSGKIAEKLLLHGYQVYNLYGGIFNWVNQGNDLTDNASQKTINIHGFDKKWSKWLKRGEIKY